MARKNVVVYQLLEDQSLAADSVQASVIIQDITYEAVNAGTAGNDITIEYLNDGVAGSETVDVAGTSIVVHMQSAASTATQILAAINGSAPALLLVSATISGTPSDAQVAVAATNLASGENSTFISPVTLTKNLDNCSYQINVETDDSEGSFVVQASLDYEVSEPTNVVTNPGSWFDLMLSGGTPTVAAENDTIGIDLNQLPFIAIRLVYTGSVPGDGTCNVYIAARQLGG